MSTRSLICEELDNGKYKTIYCHSDGYLTYNGAMLIDHFNDRKKLEELLALGDISQLKPNLYPDPRYPHSFDESQDEVVVAYGRDRGESDIEARELMFEDLVDKSNWTEYVYIFDKNNTWQVLEYPYEKMITVEEGVEKEYKKMGIKRPPNCYGFLTSEELRRIKKKQAEEAM